MHERARKLLFEKDLYDEKPIIVVFGYSNTGRLPYIHGAYRSIAEGMDVMQSMENSSEYAHLEWSNKVIKVIKVKK